MPPNPGKMPMGGSIANDPGCVKTSFFM